jgi:hypothetical protein
MDCCPKERVPQTPQYHRFGVVADAENVLYVVLYPDQYSGGELSTGAFSKSKLRSCELSVCRMHHSSSSEVMQQVVCPQLARNPKRSFVGALYARAEEIRSIRADVDDTVQVICVIDDGRENYKAHAHMCYSDCVVTCKTFWQRNRQVAVRAELIARFQRRGIFKDLETAFQAAQGD